jgi:hypothetical protein
MEGESKMDKVEFSKLKCWKCGKIGCVSKEGGEGEGLCKECTKDFEIEGEEIRRAEGRG